VTVRNGNGLPEMGAPPFALFAKGGTRCRLMTTA
jgi:hypothetical protein